MAKLVQWVKKAVGTILDPDRDERVEQLTRVLVHGVCTQRQRFSLIAAIQGAEFSAHDVEVAKEEAYCRILAKGWADGQLSAEEREIARWVATVLQISAERARQINVEAAREYFATALAQSMEDGVLTPEEESRLQAIAGSVGAPMAQFARQFFRSEGEAFLRGIFMSSISDGHISPSEWTRLLTTTQKLGITHDELLQAIQPQAQRFAEHVLADAKADGRLSGHEEATLNWIVDALQLPRAFRDYLQAETRTLRTLTAIEEGRLPTVARPSGIETRAGEIIYYHGAATWQQLRVRKNGPMYDLHEGTLTLTDSRLIFSSSTKSQTINYRRIVSHRGTSDRIDVQIEGKPLATFLLGQVSPIPYAAFAKAVAMANQTATARVAGNPSRHIPREIRQRIWQRYGGRCAECGAADYLEFDHIVPVAKGGSNSENNVQLLCRRCNLKKSDQI